MRKNIQTLSANSLFIKEIPWVLSLAIVTTFLISNDNLAWGNENNIPGLPIARLALPSISSQMSEPNPTGTPIGEKTIELKNAIVTLVNRAASHVQSTRDLYETAIADVNQYHLFVSEIEAKLQLGTTPANPTLITLKNQALQKLDALSQSIHMMTGLAVSFSNNSQQVETLFSQIKDFLLLPGAIDQDHANLILMAEELGKLNASILQSREILDANTLRQTEWLNAERIHIANLSAAVDKGKSQILLQGTVPTYPIPASLPELPLPLMKEESEIKLETPEPSPDSLAVVPLLQTQQEIREEMAQTPQIKPSEPLALVPLLESPQAIIENVPQTETLSTVNIEPPLKALPLQEEALPELIQSQTQASQESPTASTVLGDRLPLAIIEADKEIFTQKWYLFSTAKRGLKKPTDVVEIVNVVKGKSASSRGEEVKNLLIEMGIPPEQLRVINAQANDNKTEQVYILEEK